MLTVWSFNMNKFKYEEERSSRWIKSNAFKNQDKKNQLQNPRMRIWWSSEFKLRSFFSIRILRQTNQKLLNAKEIRKVTKKDSKINYFRLKDYKMITQSRSVELIQASIRSSLISCSSLFLTQTSLKSFQLRTRSCEDRI